MRGAAVLDALRRLAFRAPVGFGLLGLGRVEGLLGPISRPPEQSTVDDSALALAAASGRQVLPRAKNGVGLRRRRAAREHAAVFA